MNEDALQMDPNVWGPPLWDLLFVIAFKSKLDSTDMQHLFSLLEKVIPCQHCRRSYTLYRTQVKPTTVIRNDVSESAAMWLWTIHDMVNQKLGKICISYEKLAKRHRSFAVLSNDFVIIDLLCMIASVCKPIYVVKFAKLVMKALADVFSFKISHTAITIREVHLMDDLYELYTAVCALHNQSPLLTRDAFKQQHTKAYV